MADIAVYTVGCKVNQAESGELAMGLEAAGREVCRDPSAYLCVVNTCTVTAESDRKCRKLIRWLHKRGAERIVAAGCYAQIDPGALASLPGVVRILPNSRKDTWVDELAEMCGGGSRGGGGYPYHARGFVKVQDGCERRCSYCIVPAARGAETSRPPREVLKVAGEWLRAGACELVLCGINLGRYRGGHAYDLAALVRQVLAAGDGFRLRLSSIELEDLRPRWLEDWAASGRVCPHLHLPLQSGYAPLLEEMGRGYGPEDYVAASRALRSAWPEAALTTEVMVGFPGESEAAFAATVEVLEEVRPARVHVFRFSPRPGTKAMHMGGRVPAAVAEARSARLRGMAEAWRLAYIEERVGDAREMLVERFAGGEAVGTTEDYMQAVLPHPPSGASPGCIVSATICGMRDGRALLEARRGSARIERDVRRGR